jgi:hypothetical protein
MIKIEPLVRGVCPICNKTIMNQNKTAYTNGGFEFWVKFSDGSKACFAICSDCFDKITPEQLDDIMKRQKVSWGQEIQAQLNWYVKEVVNLKIVKHAKTKEGLV